MSIVSVRTASSQTSLGGTIIVVVIVDDVVCVVVLIVVVVVVVVVVLSGGSGVVVWTMCGPAALKSSIFSSILILMLYIPPIGTFTNNAESCHSSD